MEIARYIGYIRGNGKRSKRWWDGENAEDFRCVDLQNGKEAGEEEEARLFRDFFPEAQEDVRAQEGESAVQLAWHLLQNPTIQHLDVDV